MTNQRPKDETKSIKQRRMEFAYEQLSRVINKKEIATRLKGLPIAIRMNGLAVVGAQFSSSDEIRPIGKMLSKWLLKECPMNIFSEQRNKTEEDANIKRLLELCIKATRTEYAAAQQEAIAFLDCAKLIAEALED